MAEERLDQTAVTAGFLNTDWNPRDVPDGTITRNVVLRTADHAAVTGSLYLRGKPDTVVCVMHPREFMACHYLIPDIIEAGCAAWSQGSRSVGNDLRLEHEVALFDVAAGLTFLRRQGFRRIVLLGNSGGASLYAFYVQQSSLDGGRRIARTPGGRPTRLDALDMPEIDGFVFVAPHPGQGLLLMGCIDPSVTDERDPLSVDPALDALDPRNGFAEPPHSSRYSAVFLDRYRDAQKARVARLDAVARDLIAARMDARKTLKEGGADEGLRRRAAHTPIMTVWRTDADPRCFDLSLDPMGQGSARLELRRGRLRAQLHAGGLALDLVGPELECGAGKDRALDHAADFARGIYRRRFNLPVRGEADLRRRRRKGEIPHPRSRRPSRPRLVQGRGTGPRHRRTRDPRLAARAFRVNPAGRRGNGKGRRACCFTLSAPDLRGCISPI